MPNHKHIDIPNSLQHHRTSIENSILPYNAIILTNDGPTLYNSKFGGYPYIPKSSAYPKDDDGNYMPLLAQINFAEVQLESPFPDQGILQFFIAQHLYEKNKENPRINEFSLNYIVRYYPYILDEPEIIHDFSSFSENYADSFPLHEERKITFKAYFEPVSATDYRIQHYFDVNNLNQIIADDGRTMEDVYLEHYLGAEHKIGGYPYFIHEDFRLYSEEHKHFDTLLLQIVSDDEEGIMWGDCGVIKFFINKENLQQLDFSNVYLHVEDY